MHPDPGFRIFFGGPDRPPRALRDLLHSRVAGVPPGGEIFWATYYFRDQSLADALVLARRRGVNVRLTLEANPRTAHANRPVFETLQSPAGLDGGLRALKHLWPENLQFWRNPRLHIKLYYFSHPEPHVLLGTFNPSGNRPEDPAIVAEIGDQDRGHNFLLEWTDRRLVSPLREHIRLIHTSFHGPWERLLPDNNRVIATDDTRIFLFPRIRRGVIRRKLKDLPTGAVLRLAVSHMNDRRIVRSLALLADRGVRIEILAHDTKRRVPHWGERSLNRNGITFRRYVHPENLPMHNKFILVETPERREVLFGSMNLSGRSLHANHELLVASENLSLFQAFEERWKQMLRETETIL